MVEEVEVVVEAMMVDQEEEGVVLGGVTDRLETSHSSRDGSNTQCSSSTSFSGCWEVSLDMHEISQDENATCRLLKKASHFFCIMTTKVWDLCTRYVQYRKGLGRTHVLFTKWHKRLKF